MRRIQKFFFNVTGIEFFNFLLNPIVFWIGQSVFFAGEGHKKIKSHTLGDFLPNSMNLWLKCVKKWKPKFKKPLKFLWIPRFAWKSFKHDFKYFSHSKLNNFYGFMIFVCVILFEFMFSIHPQSFYRFWRY